MTDDPTRPAVVAPTPAARGAAPSRPGSGDGVGDRQSPRDRDREGRR